MTISLTVILIESTNEITYGLPIMITLMVSAPLPGLSPVQGQVHPPQQLLFESLFCVSGGQMDRGLFQQGHL